jgi:hypothetical protein
MTRNTAKQDALLDELLKDYTDPKDILGEPGLLRQLTTRLVERALAALVALIAQVLSSVGVYEEHGFGTEYPHV